MTVGRPFCRQVRVGQDLLDRLGLAVGPAARERAPEDPVVLLAELVARVLAVDLARARDQHLGAVLVGLLEDDLATADVRRQALERLVHDQLNADGGREVEADVGPGHEVIEQVGVEDAAKDELDAISLAQVLDVLEPTSAEVVQQDQAVAAGKEGVGMGADEAGSAGAEGERRSDLTPEAGQAGCRTTGVGTSPVRSRSPCHLLASIHMS